MRKFVVCLFLGILTCLARGEERTDASVDAERKARAAEFAKLTPRERMERSRQRREEAVRRNGGLVEAPITGRVIRVVNRQRIVARELVERTAEEISDSSGFAIEVIDDPATDGRTEIAIELVDTVVDPTLMIAPEDKLGRINVSRLVADKPSGILLEARFQKEFWRALAMTMGAANSNFKPSVMRNVFSLADLDADPARVPCPEVIDKVQKTAYQLSVARRHKVSYKRACREGWAPQPTNDIQKAIWKEVHEIPSKPIKIEFNEKRDKGK